MIKFVLILHLCSFLNTPDCFQETIAPLEFDDHYSCMVHGYKQSGRQIENLGKDRVNPLKLAIRFECREIKIQQT